MRRIINKKKQLTEIEMAKIQFDPKSRDDIPQILRGLQYIYTLYNGFGGERFWCLNIT